MLLLALSGLLLFRLAQRALLALLFQLPPRSTRLEPVGLRPKSFHDVSSKPSTAARQSKGDQSPHSSLHLEFCPRSLKMLPLIPAEFAHEPALAPAAQA